VKFTLASHRRSPTYASTRRWLTGSEHGRAIRRRELAPLRAVATRILNAYGARADVQAAVKWCDLLLASNPQRLGSNSRDHRFDGRAGQQLQRLRGEGVTGRDVLLTALTVYAYSYRFHASLPDDLRLTYELGRTLVRLRPLPCKAFVSATIYRTLGLLLREALVVLLHRLIRLHDHDREAERMATPTKHLPRNSREQNLPSPD